MPPLRLTMMDSPARARRPPRGRIATPPPCPEPARPKKLSVLQLNWEYERMRRHVWWTASSLALTVGIWLVTVSGTQSAGADDDAKTAILKLADGKGDPEAIA